MFDQLFLLAQQTKHLQPPPAELERAVQTGLSVGMLFMGLMCLAVCFGLAVVVCTILFWIWIAKQVVKKS